MTKRITSSATTARALWVCALLGTLLAASACKHDADPVAAWIAANDMLAAARCGCSSARECGEPPVSACLADALRMRADAIGSWLACEARVTRDQAACVRKMCSEDDGACDDAAERGDDACGELPSATLKALQQDLARMCPDPGAMSGGSRAVAGRPSGARDAGITLPPPTSVVSFACDDGFSISLPQVCDGLIDCGSGIDEASCFVCEHDGRTIRDGLTCDGVFNCADGSDESTPCGQGTPAADADGGVVDPTTEACLTLTPVTPLIDPSCVGCLCEAAPQQTTACGADCWELVQCVITSCPKTAPNSSEQTTCAINECARALSGATFASALRPAFMTACSTVCPQF